MASITRVNGPISIDILRSPNGKVTFYLFGDSHFSREHGCDDPNSIRMNNGELEGKSSTIDIDALFYIWLLHNNSHNIRTSLFLELSYVPKKRETKALDWIDACELLKEQEFKFSPYCNIVPSDIRINNITNKSDILSHLHIELLTSGMLSEYEMLELMKITQIIFDSSMDIFDAYCQVNGLVKLNVLKSKLYSLSTSKVCNRCLYHLEKMEEDLEEGHLISQKLDTLRMFNEVTATICRINLRYFRDKYEALSRELIQFNSDTDIAIAVATYTDINLVKDVIFGSRIKSILNVLVTMSSWIMDIYLITIAFLSRSPEKIIYAGNNHTIEYLDLLKAKHGYTHLVHTVSSDKQERCLDATDLVMYIDLDSYL